MSVKNGYIYLWREGAYDRLKHFRGDLHKVFEFCLIEMAFAEYTVGGFTVLPGKFLVGRFKGAEKLGWHSRKGEIREKDGSRFYRNLMKLKELRLVDTRTVYIPDTQGFHDVTLVTVYNHLSYLNPDEAKKDTKPTHPAPPKTSLHKEDLTIPKGMVGENTVVKRKLKTKPREETRPVLDYFCNKYKEHIGHPYHINWAKDSSCIKRLLDSGFTATTLFKLMDMFINDKDSFLNKTGHTISMFSARINSYVKQLDTEAKIPSKPFDTRHIPESKTKEKENQQKYLLARFEAKYGGKENIPDDWWKLIYPNDATNPHRKP